MGHSGGQVAWARHQHMPLCMHGLSQIAKTMVFMVIPFLEEVAVVFGIVKEMTFSIAGDVIMLSMEGFPL